MSEDGYIKLESKLFDKWINIIKSRKSNNKINK